jgi:two-component system, NtrC family, nitrogen regulation sensor histidine kinase GlnL
MIPFSTNTLAYAAFDHLATMVAVIGADGLCVFANAAFESTLGLPRRSVQRGSLFDWIVDAQHLRDTVAAVARNDYATGRLDALLHCPSAHAEHLCVHIIVNQMDAAQTDATWVNVAPLILVELIEIEQQTRQDREERALDQAQVTKELLEMELEDRSLHEYTQVIIKEADRLQALVDRLLAPHRRPRVVSDVNIHEVCERVRALILAEFPRGLTVQRDYDTSIPEFRGDLEQLIQAVLNIAQNAAQALAERLEAQDACIILRTRIARQVTVGKQRCRLALDLHIEDNGCGVPESIRDRIFYPLVSGRDGGSGLGLTLAQTFVQQHAGLIECESKPGLTVFRIVIPLP